MIVYIIVYILVVVHWLFINLRFLFHNNAIRTQRIYIIQMLPPELMMRLAELDPDAETTHDSVVQNNMIEKYENMKKEYDLENSNQINKFKSARFIEYFKDISKTELESLQKLRKIICDDDYVVNLKATELEIFSIVWHFVLKHKLDPNTVKANLLECVEVCLMGRVARYISIFEGLTDDYKGKSTVTENILFQEALREAQMIFQTELQNADLDSTEGQLLLQQTKRTIAQMLEKYDIPDMRKQEILTALD